MLKFGLFLFFFSISTSGSQRNRNYKVTYSNGVEVSREDDQIQCYQFTWLGPKEDWSNDTDISCDFFKETNIPCFEPIVFTEGPNRNNRPVLEEIEEKCNAGQTLDGSHCKPFCTKDDKSCVKYTYTSRNQYSTVLLESHFCGEGVEVSKKGQVIVDGCHIQKEVEGCNCRTEVCFCQGSECNQAVYTSGQSNEILITLAIAFLECNFFLLQIYDNDM